MMNKKTHTLAFYIAIILYVLFIFLTQWSLSASRLDALTVQEIFRSIITWLVIPSIIMLLAYNIASNFKYYAEHKIFTCLSILSISLVAISSSSLSLTLPLLLGFAGFAAQNRKIAKIVLISFTALFIVSIILSAMGLNGGDTYSKPLFGIDNQILANASAFGLANPNAAMIILFNITALTMFLGKTLRQNIFSVFFLTILTLTLSFATGSTTGILVGLGIIFIVLYSRRSKNISKRLKKITPWMFTIITIATFIVSINFGETYAGVNQINDFLSGRPGMWNLRIENDSYINLFGNNDQYQVNRVAGDKSVTQALDNTPLYILVYQGIIVYVIFWYIFYAGSRSIKEPEIIAYIFVATLLMFTEKMELYGLVLIFLQKSITEQRLLLMQNKMKATK